MILVVVVTVVVVVVVMFVVVIVGVDERMDAGVRGCVTGLVGA